MEKKEGKSGKRTRKKSHQKNKKREQVSDEELDQLRLRNKLN